MLWRRRRKERRRRRKIKEEINDSHLFVIGAELF